MKSHKNFEIIEHTKSLVLAYEGYEIIFNYNVVKDIVTGTFKGKCFHIENLTNNAVFWIGIKNMGIDIPITKSTQVLNWLRN